jgi:hypothetical protein
VIKSRPEQWLSLRGSCEFPQVLQATDATHATPISVATGTTHQSQELEERAILLGGGLRVASAGPAAAPTPPLERAEGRIALLVCAR